ncbi:MAG: hypothetical protein ACI9V1_002142 [Spirosomataceae bacterium]|jgi:hypothetical protein
MGVLILNKDLKSREEVLSKVVVAAFKIGASIRIDENRTECLPSESKLEITISKHFEDNEEYFILNLEREESVLSAYELLDFEIGKYYRLGVTDHADCQRLIYCFSLAYLELNPNQVISTYGDQFFTLKDLERMENEGGYFEDWCYAKLPWQKESI